MKTFALMLLFMIVSAAALAQRAAAQRRVEMSWSPTSGATGYEFKLYKVIQGDEKEFLKEEVPSTVWSKSLAPGDYYFQIRALDYRGVAGKWAPKKYFKVSLPTVNQVSPVLSQGFDLIEDSEIPVNFVWEEVPEADRYNFKLKNASGSILEDENVTDTFFNYDFANPGRYYWKVTALTAKDSDPKQAEFKNFFVVHPPKMQAPEVQFEVKDKYFSIFWDSSMNSHKDKINIYHQRNNRWFQIYKAEKKKIRKVNLNKNKIPKGKYKLKLVSFTDQGRPSEPSTILFNWDAKDKQITNVENKSFANRLVQSKSALLQKFGQTPWSFGFGMASSSMRYTGTISERDTLIQSEFSGNNYSFYAERHFKDSKWSWQTDGWASSLINAQNSWFLFNIASMANYKMGNLIHEYDFEAGASYRSLPFFDANVATSESASSNIDFLSLAAGGDYYYHVNDAISLGGNARLYLNTYALSHPLGHSMEPSLSHSYDLGARYRISKDIFTHFRVGVVNDALVFENGDEQTYDSTEFGINLKIHF